MKSKQLAREKRRISSADYIKLCGLSNGTFQQATLLWFNTERNFGLVRMFDNVCVLVHNSVIKSSKFNRKLLIEKNLSVLVLIGLGMEANVFKVKKILPA